MAIAMAKVRAMPLVSSEQPGVRNIEYVDTNVKMKYLNEGEGRRDKSLNIAVLCCDVSKMFKVCFFEAG